MSPGIPEDLAEHVERKFMGMVDNLAKDALNILLGASNARWTDKTRSAWARFVNGLIFRVPERVASARAFLEGFWKAEFEQHKANYDAQKGPNDPEYANYIPEAINRETLEFIMKQIDDKRIGTLLARMRWRTIDVSPTGRCLFTSDRPIIMSNGLAYAESYLLMPLSPTRLFLTTNSAGIENYFANVIERRELVKMCNRHVVRRAQKYAWSTDDSELDFVRKHLSAEADMDRQFWEARPNTFLQLNRSASKA
jgi:hypothetical protein